MRLTRSLGTLAQALARRSLAGRSPLEGQHSVREVGKNMLEALAGIGPRVRFLACGAEAFGMVNSRWIHGDGVRVLVAWVLCCRYSLGKVQVLVELRCIVLG